MKILENTLLQFALHLNLQLLDPTHLVACVSVGKCRQPHTSFVRVQNDQMQISSHLSPECCYLQALPVLLSPAPGWTLHQANTCFAFHIVLSLAERCQMGPAAWRELW